MTALDLTTLTKSEQTLIRNADAVARFREESGRWPSDTGTTPRERSLARNLRTLRRNDLPDEIAAYVRGLLGAMAPLQDRTPKLTVDEALDAFRRQHGRSPKHNGATKDERSLARRLLRAKGRQRVVRAAAPLTPTGREARPDLERFERRLDALLRVRDELGDWPTLSNARNPEDRGLADFCIRLRNHLPPSFAAVLSRRAPDLARRAFDPRSVGEANLAKAIPKIGAYLAEHGHLPRHTDHDPRVRSLARYMGRLRKHGVSPRDRPLVDRWLPSLALPTAASMRR